MCIYIYVKMWIIKRKSIFAQVEEEPVLDEEEAGVEEEDVEEKITEDDDAVGDDAEVSFIRSMCKSTFCVCVLFSEQT